LIIMRTYVLTVLLSLGVAASGGAQSTSANAAATPAAQTEPADGLLREPAGLQSGIDFASRWLEHDGEPKDGFYPDFSLVTGAGWISVGPGYRRHLFDGKALVDASALMSWRAYKQAQARVELPRIAADRVTLGAQVRWQDFTQVNYFGRGPNSLEGLRSEYRLKDTDVLGYGAVRANDWLSVTGRFGWLKTPTLSASAGPFDQNFPDALEVFAGDPGVGDPTSFLHGDVGLTADSRDHADRPTSGALYRASGGFYSDRNLGLFSFRRYDAEGLQVVPVVRDKWHVVLHGWGVFSDTSSGNDVPFYLLPTLGGDRTLRGFHNFRFHDRNLLLASAESRWAIFRQVDAALFVDAGNVAPRLRDLDLNKTSYGAGVRVHGRTSTLGRLDFAHSREGWEIFFSLKDPFALTRRTERSTIVPFVP
jgi:hypothetical protein